MKPDMLYEENTSLPPVCDTTEDTTENITPSPTSEDYEQKPVLVIISNEELHGKVRYYFLVEENIFWRSKKNLVKLLWVQIELDNYPTVSYPMDDLSFE